MFVVRIETDEALKFRAFRKYQAARDWASLQCRNDDQDCFHDVYDASGHETEMRAVEAVRDGRARLMISSDKLMEHDFRQGSTFLAGIGIGTGAGF